MVENLNKSATVLCHSPTLSGSNNSNRERSCQKSRNSVRIQKGYIQKVGSVQVSVWHAEWHMEEIASKGKALHVGAKPAEIAKRGARLL